MILRGRSQGSLKLADGILLIHVRIREILLVTLIIINYTKLLYLGVSGPRIRYVVNMLEWTARVHVWGSKSTSAKAYTNESESIGLIYNARPRNQKCLN